MVSNKNILIAQGGGPTNVINQSLVGIIKQEKKYKSKILGSINGVNGIINNRFISLNKISENDLKTIADTPGAALGSTRDKPDQKYCKEILKILKNKKISKFYYIGGNDSSDSLRIISEYAKNIQYKLQCIHIPKTIDNDLVCNDHTPGFGSAAKYVAQLFSGINYDVKSLPGVYLGIVMGRHAGFLTASSSLLKKENKDGPNLIYIPESPFEINTFLNQVKSVFNKYGRCVIAISEGIQDKHKKLISQKIIKKTEYDAHGNIQLSGTGSLGDYLSVEIKEKLKLPRVRADTLGYPQRCFLGSASEIDQKEALKIGIFAAKYSNKHITSFSAGILERKKFTNPYNTIFIANSLEKVAGKTKVMHQSFYNIKKSFVTNSFINYALPLIGKNLLKTKSII
ncbi:MAG: 6-phosphofructokinase [Rickettsiales bacterium]|nr:6-phosphofructokinase [Rickettsiales bacterium]|tara:strand:+ start:336 stop:1529 length:1194 start_codon:yes stop_codon:yes gene_type:complete